MSSSSSSSSTAAATTTTTTTTSSPTPKVALVTGATGGIGRATALALASAGYTLALHYHRADETKRKALLAAVTSAQKAGNLGSSAGAALFQADMASLDDVAALHAAVVSSLGAPLVVFLNAGTRGADSGPDAVPAAGAADMADISPEAFEATWRVNTLAPFQLARLCVGRMRDARWGRIVFCSSVAATMGGVIGPHYASSKAALHGLVHWLAPRVAGQGVTVNAVAPALVQDTGLLPHGSPELAARLPVGRLGRPQEIADTVMWMVNNAYLTNKVVAVDGGLTVQ